MNRKLLCVLPLTIVFWGCAQMQHVGEPVCGDYDDPIPNDCLGDPKTPIVIVNTKKLTVSPYCVRAHAGRTITFKFIPKAPDRIGAVALFPKDPADDWLAKSNSPDKNFIYVEVPKDLAAGVHDYGIKGDKKCVDPRVRVEAPGPGPGS